MDDSINTLYDLIKSYHIFKRFDSDMAASVLTQIQNLRLQIAILAASRDIFIDQLPVPANASGYRQDIFFIHDDIVSSLSRAIAFLDIGALASVTQQATRERLFTRQAVDWPHLFSDVQDGSVRGQQIPFSFNQDVLLDKSQTLDFGITSQTSAGMLFVHGANLPDTPSLNKAALAAEIAQADQNGQPILPELQLVPIQFQFANAVVGDPAIALDGSKQIYSLKNERSVILTEVSSSVRDCRVTLVDLARNNTICSSVEMLGIAGQMVNPFAAYYPLPYPYLLTQRGRIQLMGLNGSDITGVQASADTPFTLCFKGFTI